MNRKFLWVVLAVCLATALGIGFTTRVHSGTVAKEAAVVRPADEAWRSSLPRDPDASTQAYLARLSSQARNRSDAYFTGGYWIQLWGTLTMLAAFWILLGTGASAAMRDFAERITRRKPLQTMLYMLQYSAAIWVIGLPLAVLGDFAREHWYGMANQAFGPWMREQLVAFLVSTLITAVAFALLYGVIRRCKRTWWIWGSCVTVLFMVFMILIAPVFIDPLFNTYKPLPEGPVRQSILSLARANGIPAKDVYQFDASKQTDRVSANVSGVFGTTSVRLNDNLLNRSSLPEIKAVMAHEMGHYVLNHVFKSIVMIGVILVVGFGFLFWGFNGLLPRWGTSWGIRDVGDTAGFPLLSGLLTLFMFCMTPVMNTMVRVQEAEADVFGINASQEPDGFAEAQLKLIEYRKADPGPVEEFLFYDHPSPRKRIQAAMRWKAEHFPNAQ